MSDSAKEGNFVEELRRKMIERVQEGNPIIDRNEVEEIATSYDVNTIRASQIFRSLEGELWRGSLISVDEAVPRDWIAVNDLEVLS